jgi:hypothetical protein
VVKWRRAYYLTLLKCKSTYIRSRRACDKFASTLYLFRRCGDVEAGHVTLNLRIYLVFLLG